MSVLYHTLMKKCLYFIRKTTTHKHRSKFIILVLLAFISQLLYRKLTVGHIMMIIQKIINFTNYLPLPENVKYRSINSYEYADLKPLQQIVQASNIDALQTKIRKKQAKWEDLKHAVINQCVLSMIVYDVKQIYYNVQNKYQLDFKQLGTQHLFDEAMEVLIKSFVQEIPIIFQIISMLLYQEIEKVYLKDLINLNTLEHLFQSLVNKVFKDIIVPNMWQQYYSYQKKSNESAYQKAYQLFVSPLEISSNIEFPKKIAKSINSAIKNTIQKVWNLIPEVKVQLSQERFKCIETFYILPLKKANIDFEWQNHESEILWKMVYNQIEQLLFSVSFCTLLWQNSILNLKILSNRFMLYFESKYINEVQLFKFLPDLHKIVKQELLKPKQNRKRYYEKQLMLAMKDLHKKEQQQQIISNRNRILKEIYMQNKFAHLEKEFLLKYFHERQQITIKTMHSNNQQQLSTQEDQDIKQMLMTFGTSNLLQ